VASTSRRESSVIWHDAECGGYAADLALWEELAAQAEGTLDVGCGTGRVALHLGRRGHRVVGLDLSADFAAVVNERVGSLPVEVVVGDARDFALSERFGVVLAPMQLLQLFADAEERVRCLRCVAAHLAAGGVAAFAIVESMPEPVDAPPPLPDTREVEGWVYSSLPIEAATEPGRIRVRRLRQTVSPAGVLREEVDETILQALDAETLEREAGEADLVPVERRPIPATEAHIGSTVVLFEKEP
jgi:SAM-dependent methyltransferase